MAQTAIPYVFMRGGTLRGPYFRRSDLPGDMDRLADVLVAVLGAGQGLNSDGIGGVNAVTTKVAMLSVSADDWADIDYFFAQVSVEEKRVDFKPTCGNILSGVAPAAIEMGLFQPQGDETEIRIRAVNTDARVGAKVQTPGGELTYAGDTEIVGVPGRAAPVQLSFMGVVGSATGAFLPTGNLRDTVQGIELTCMDVAMPMAIARAADFGLTGYESVEELEANRSFFDRMEAIRMEAGALMGMGDVSKSVTPKFGLMAPAPGWRDPCSSVFHAVEAPFNDGGYRRAMYGVLYLDAWNSRGWGIGTPRGKSGGYCSGTRFGPDRRAGGFLKG